MKIKWLMYTVLVGLIPIFARILIWTISQNRNLDLVSAADLAVFGLILHISNINEIAHFNKPDQPWRITQNGISIAFISGYSILLASYLLEQTQPGIINLEFLRYISIAMCVTSFIIRFTVYNRLAKLA